MYLSCIKYHEPKYRTRKQYLQKLSLWTLNVSNHRLRASLCAMLLSSWRIGVHVGVGSNVSALYQRNNLSEQYRYYCHRSKKLVSIDMSLPVRDVATPWHDPRRASFFFFPYINYAFVSSSGRSEKRSIGLDKDGTRRDAAPRRAVLDEKEEVEVEGDCREWRHPPEREDARIYCSRFERVPWSISRLSSSFLFRAPPPFPRALCDCCSILHIPLAR